MAVPNVLQGLTMAKHDMHCFMQERLAAEVDRLRDSTRSVIRERHPDADAELARLRQVKPSLVMAIAVSEDGRSCYAVHHALLQVYRYLQDEWALRVRYLASPSQELEDCRRRLADAEAAKADAMTETTVISQQLQVCYPTQTMLRSPLPTGNSVSTHLQHGSPAAGAAC